MIADLNPYPGYKESGRPWLGRVPGHWAVRRMKSAVMNVIEQTFEMSSEEVYVALEHVESWTGKARPQSDPGLFTGQVKRFRKGDVLFGKLRPYLAKVTRISKDGVCAGEFFVLRPTDKAVSSAYLEHQLRAKHTIDVINGSTFGAKMPRADWQFCGNLPFPLPPPAEQAAIVRFLDWASGRLERAIGAKRKVIALLNEQKQAIIHRAVTRGLGPSVSLKPSGIPWLGDIPQHWEVRRLKHCISPIEQGWSPQCDAQPADENEWGVLKVGCVNKDSFSPNQNKKLPASLQPDHSLEIRDGDVLVSRANTRELLGLAALAENPPGKRILCDKLFRFRAKGDSFNSKFLVLALRAKPCREQIESSTNGASSSMQNIGQGVLKNLWVAMPAVVEQDSIVTHIAIATQPASVAISRLEREIQLLREYRTRLVADVVTGKLDVREAAARLPDEPAPDPVEDDTDLNLDPEAADEEATV
jgi:type I restriction enzyme, S subunit